MTTQELKKLFQDLAKQSREYDELQGMLESMVECSELTWDEYDIIEENWDEWLPEEDE